jgi:hypothetical protein
MNGWGDSPIQNTELPNDQCQIFSSLWVFYHTSSPLPPDEYSDLTAPCSHLLSTLSGVSIHLTENVITSSCQAVSKQNKLSTSPFICKCFNMPCCCKKEFKEHSSYDQFLLKKFLWDWVEIMATISHCISRRHTQDNIYKQLWHSSGNMTAYDVGRILAMVDCHFVKWNWSKSDNSWVQWCPNTTGYEACLQTLAIV